MSYSDFDRQNRVIGNNYEWIIWNRISIVGGRLRSFFFSIFLSLFFVRLSSAWTFSVHISSIPTIILLNNHRLLVCRWRWRQCDVFFSVETKFSEFRFRENCLIVSHSFVIFVASQFCVLIFCCLRYACISIFNP